MGDAELLDLVVTSAKSPLPVWEGAGPVSTGSLQEAMDRAAMQVPTVAMSPATYEWMVSQGYLG